MSDSIGTAEASIILEIDPRSVARLCDRGVIKAQKISTVWVIDRASVLAYKEENQGRAKHDPRRKGNDV